MKASVSFIYRRSVVVALDGADNLRIWCAPVSDNDDRVELGQHGIGGAFELDQLVGQL
ncbi:hypothetical protein [Nitrosovibrio sp. Nv4]|uniref:hypothetical protein n=1 Tax=Nitrosovibrio sp. Nv4 TaxID=1945880 RepID=UPI00190E81EA|nr:hypothetical protein [Nitrosovibrio sp. Nv4]